MSIERYARSEALFGTGVTDILKQAHVAVFGLGGVGSFAVEALARMGIGSLTLIDGDAYSESNLNRQLFATEKTLGMPKPEAAMARVGEVNSSVKVFTHSLFVTPENLSSIDFSAFDYVVDAIDAVSAKIAIIKRASETDIPVISAMGAGNKTDPTLFRVADISKTKVCPLARAVRNGLRREGILHAKVVYSEEAPVNITAAEDRTPASASFVPSVMGLIMAGEVIKDLLKNRKADE